MGKKYVKEIFGKLSLLELLVLAKPPYFFINTHSDSPYHP